MKNFNFLKTLLFLTAFLTSTSAFTIKSAAEAVAKLPRERKINEAEASIIANQLCKICRGEKPTTTMPEIALYLFTAIKEIAENENVAYSIQLIAGSLDQKSQAWALSEFGKNEFSVFIRATQAIYGATEADFQARLFAYHAITCAAHCAQILTKRADLKAYLAKCASATLEITTNASVNDVKFAAATEAIGGSKLVLLELEGAEKYQLVEIICAATLAIEAVVNLAKKRLAQDKARESI